MSEDVARRVTCGQQKRAKGPQGRLPARRGGPKGAGPPQESQARVCARRRL